MMETPSLVGGLEVIDSRFRLLLSLFSLLRRVCLERFYSRVDARIPIASSYLHLS